MKEYVNKVTGEIVSCKSWFSAYRYYLKDSKKYGYSFRWLDIVLLSKYR